MSDIIIGAAGWSYPDWKGIVYPDKLPREASQLAWLAQYLDAVEINTSFYRPVAPGLAAGWLKQTASTPRFLFTAKLWQRLTHERAEAWSPQDAKTVKAGLLPLKEASRFGALLMQFPWSFKPDDGSRDWLRRLADEFRDWPCVVEVRHAGWNTEENRSFLRATGLGFCNIDQPRLRGNLPRTAIVTAPVAYMRLHGRNAKAWFDEDAGRDMRYDYLYSQGELAPIARDIESMRQQAARTFVIANNHYRGQEVVNALQLKARLSGAPVSAPEPLVKAFPFLRKICAAPAPAQKELF